MLKAFKNLFSAKPDLDILYALQYKLPDSVDVTIEEDPDGGYVAHVLNLGGNVVTQGDTGLELFEMVNDAILMSYDIPEEYRSISKNFFPPEDVRKQLEIPAKYLKNGVTLART